MWHRLLTERYGITDERALRMRIHIVTSGIHAVPAALQQCGLLMALTAVLGGAQSLGVSGYDEAISIPSEHAHQMVVRIQQILEHETNIPAVTDPLGGSYYVEFLYSRTRASWLGVHRPDPGSRRFPGHAGFRLAARPRENQHEQALAETRGERKIVGVNCFKEDITPFEWTVSRRSPMRTTSRSNGCMPSGANATSREPARHARTRSRHAAIPGAISCQS